MELQTFEVQSRSEKGKGAAGRTRQAGNVPGVLYGAGKENASVIAGSKELEHLLHHGQGEHAMVELSCPDNPDLNGPAMVKAVQHHPVRGNALHFDLIRIDLTKKITTFVPVKMEGHSVGIVAGGVFDYHMREIEVECLPLDVPDFFIGDITNVDIGQSVHISELIAIDNVTILGDPSRTVGAIHEPRVILDEKPVEEEGEGEGVDGEATDESSDSDSTESD